MDVIEVVGKVDGLFILADATYQAMVQAILHAANKDDVLMMLWTLKR